MGKELVMDSSEPTSLPKELYLHVPFCHSRCSYCDFETSAIGAHDPLLTAYGTSLVALVAALGERGIVGDVETIYIGGGTPTTLGDLLPALVMSAAKLGERPAHEISVEANPESVSPRLLAALKASGATRVSFGVQSLQDELLRQLGRIHSASQALEALKAARNVGFAVSADLMAGIAHQKPGMLARDIQALAQAGATSISVYGLEVFEHTPLGRLVARGLVDLPSEDETADLLEEAHATLTALGFEHYEISNWALSGFMCHHNWGYWHGVPYVGIGPSAASLVGRSTYEALRRARVCLPPAPQWVERLRLVCTSSAAFIADQGDLASLSFAVEGLSSAQALAEDLMLAARCANGLSNELVLRAQKSFGDGFKKTVERLVDWELLEPLPTGGLRPTHRGWLMGNVTFEAFWNLALPSTTWTP